MHTRAGLLLINLGTPDAPTTGDVRRYLRQFLNDPRVIDIAPIARSALVNLVILPTRPRKSAEAYRTIWTERGSPLLFHSRDLAAKVQALLEPQRVVVELAMRYGSPSIDAALQRLRQQAIDRIVVFPLYPQYSAAATGSSIEAVMGSAGKRWSTPSLAFVPAFYDHPSFIDAFADAAASAIGDDVERVIFSFHGLPERQCQRTDDSGDVCLASPDCCSTIVEANRNCYRAQCFATMHALGAALGVEPDRRVISFQSRLGRTPWIKPYTDVVLPELAGQGIRRVALISPAFVADCLETLEELGIRARESWSQAGGERLDLAPCPNASDRWARAVVEIAADHSRWIATPG